MTEPTTDDLNALTEAALEAANPATQAAVSPLGIWLALAELEHHTSHAAQPEPRELSPEAQLSSSLWSSLTAPHDMFSLPPTPISALEQVERWLALATSGQITSLLAPLPGPTHLLLAAAATFVLSGRSIPGLPPALLEFTTGEYQLSAVNDLDSTGLVDYAGTAVAWACMVGAATVTYLTSAPDSALTGIDLARCAARLATGRLNPRPARELPQSTWPGLVVRDQLLDTPSERTYFVVKSFDVATELSLFDLPPVRPQLDAWAASALTSVAATHAVAIARSQLSPTPPAPLPRLEPTHHSRAAYFYATGTLGYAVLPRDDKGLPLVFTGWANNPAGDPALLDSPFDEFDFSALDLDLADMAGLYVPDVLAEFDQRVLVDARTRTLPGNFVPRDSRSIVR